MMVLPAISLQVLDDPNPNYLVVFSLALVESGFFGLSVLAISIVKKGRTKYPAFASPLSLRRSESAFSLIVPSDPPSTCAVFLLYHLPILS